ncbi:Exonuclease GOR [Fukomys damarensis]|uniref:Exonuclease GOR n=1 Tax=Fukomys damarensis TaxID=885580 RepID=A0A091DF49_FUKDA|nr:Exonuclease GOR [Fukomys damarensis]
MPEVLLDAPRGSEKGMDGRESDLRPQSLQERLPERHWAHAQDLRGLVPSSLPGLNRATLAVLVPPGLAAEEVPGLQLGEPVHSLLCSRGLCRMPGLQATAGKATWKDSDMRMVYDTFVKLDHEIVNYNTRFSGMTEADLACPVNVQAFLANILSSDSMLSGHSPDSDLLVLKMI